MSWRFGFHGFRHPQALYPCGYGISKKNSFRGKWLAPGEFCILDGTLVRAMPGPSDRLVEADGQVLRSMGGIYHYYTTASATVMQSLNAAQ